MQGFYGVPRKLDRLLLASSAEIANLWLMKQKDLSRHDNAESTGANTLRPPVLSMCWNLSTLLMNTHSSEHNWVHNE